MIKQMQNYNSYHPYIGRTPFFACQADPRFAYCLYVPPSYYADEGHAFTLLAVVHGSRRTAEGYRDALAEFADEHRCIVLAPLFPIGVASPTDQHSYKYIRHGTLRYDDVLHSMIDEVRARFPRLRERMLLHGFSGGGQFAHRYLYICPERLEAVSVGAPGTVSLIDATRDWWPGTRNFENYIGRPLDVAVLREVRVHLVVGSEDTETWDVIVSRDSPTWAPGANDAGRNRRNRLAALAASLQSHGVPVTSETVSGVGHDGMQVLESVRQFFSTVLQPEDRRP